MNRGEGERPDLRLVPDSEPEPTKRAPGVTRGRYYLAPGHPDGIPILVANREDVSQLAQMYLFVNDEETIGEATAALNQLLEHDKKRGRR